MPNSFDLIIVGAGPACETVASRIPSDRFKTALVEQELIGGECAYWACIPSKTLLRAAEVKTQAARTAGTSVPAQSWEAVAAYRDFMIRDLDDTGEVKSYDDRGVHVARGSARFVGPKTVQVGDETLRADRIVIATGSGPVIPEIDGLQGAGFWTNREATTMSEVPASACLLGGGPVGIELAQMLRRFGADVHVIEQQDRLLAREDEHVSELVLDALRDDQIRVHLGATVDSVSTGDGMRIVRFGGDDQIRCERIVIATSRAPRVDDLGLEELGIEPNHGGIAVDERCRAGDGVWAIGDVTGRMPFSHVAKYQGRVALADILGTEARASYDAVPRTVFADPEVAAVGLTERDAREAGIDVACARIELRNSIARPWTYETQARGELQLIADRKRGVLVGAWIVAPMAGEWIHYAALAIKAQVPIDVLKDTVAQFPTYTEAYLSALEQL